MKPWKSYASSYQSQRMKTSWPRLKLFVLHETTFGPCPKPSAYWIQMLLSSRQTRIRDRDEWISTRRKRRLWSSFCIFLDSSHCHSLSLHCQAKTVKILYSVIASSHFQLLNSTIPSLLVPSSHLRLLENESGHWRLLFLPLFFDGISLL